MKRTLLTAAIGIAGAAGTLLAIILGVAIALSITQWGRSLSGKTSISARPWEAVRIGYYTLLVCVFFPTIATGGYIVGRFARRSPLIAAGLAILPASLIASGFRLEMTWATIVLLFLGTGAAHMAQLSRVNPKAFRKSAAG
jgi:hypothetical protein